MGVTLMQTRLLLILNNNILFLFIEVFLVTLIKQLKL